MSNSIQSNPVYGPSRRRLRRGVSQLLTTIVTATFLGSACTNVQDPVVNPAKEAVPGSSEIDLRLNSVI